MKDMAIALDDRPGALAEMGEALGRAGVSLEGGGAFLVDGRGIAHFLVEDGAAARRALEAAGIRVLGERDVVVLRLDQEEPGQLGKAARRMAEAFTTPEIGGDHFRSSAVFLTQCHPKQTQGSDVFVGESLDQMYAKKFGQDTPIPSMQLCIENVDQSGGCSYGYSCTYTDSISWAAADQPLPMVRDPRVVFDTLFGVGATPGERRERRVEDKSLLDWLSSSVASLKNELGVRDRARLDDYLTEVREVERRIQRAGTHGWAHPVHPRTQKRKRPCSTQRKGHRRSTVESDRARPHNSRKSAAR